MSCELTVSVLNNIGELERPTQIILSCGTKLSPTNSITLHGKKFTKTLGWESFFYRRKLPANPSGSAVEGVILRPLACWDYGFESRRGHGCLSVVRVVCCQVQASLTGPICRPQVSYKYVLLIVIRCRNKPLSLQLVVRRGWTKKDRQIDRQVDRQTDR